MAQFQLELTPVTPVHIGSGEEIPGYSYFLDDYWYVYRIERVLELLAPAARAALVRVATRDVMALAAALQDHADVLKQAADFIGGYSEPARLLWEKARDNRAQALCKRLLHSQDRIYLPGSSLKGALRTALLFAYMDKPTAQLRRRDAQLLEAVTFDYQPEEGRARINHDPFRFLKVSDSDVLRDATDLRVLQRFTYRTLERHWQEQIAILAECTASSLSRMPHPGQEITLRATLTIDESTHSVVTADNDRRGRQAPWRFGIQALLDACNDFADQQLASEAATTAGLPDLAGVYSTLAQVRAELPPHAALLRLGFGSGRDAVTVNYAQPEQETSLSRLLVDGVYPLGWLEMRVLTMEGKPFTPADELPWAVPALQRAIQVKPPVLEPGRGQGNDADTAPAEKGLSEGGRQQLVGNVLDFLKRKQGE